YSPSRRWAYTWCSSSTSARRRTRPTTFSPWRLAFLWRSEEHTSEFQSPRSTLFPTRRSSDLTRHRADGRTPGVLPPHQHGAGLDQQHSVLGVWHFCGDRKSTRLNSSHRDLHSFLHDALPILLAIAQMGVHLVFFLHISTAPDSTNNILSLAFGIFV